MRSLKNSLSPKKILTASLLVSGFVLASVPALVHAQQTGAQPAAAGSQPGATQPAAVGGLPAQPAPVGAQPSATEGNAGGNASTTSALPDRPSSTYAAAPAGTLTFGERLRIFGHSFISPESIIGPALGAAVSQAENTPPEWGQGGLGYGRRFASGYGRSVIARTIEFGVATVDHEDNRYVPLREGGFLRRTEHAVAGTFVSRTGSGGNMPAISRLVGTYSAAFISNAWEPASQDTAGHALERGSTALASNVGWHMFREFSPFYHKKH